MRLEADGLRKGRSLVAAKEEDIYRALGLPFTDRNFGGRGEIERAERQAAEAAHLLEPRLDRLPERRAFRGSMLNG